MSNVKPRRNRSASGVGLICCACVALPGVAQLQPRQCALIARDADTTSLSLARDYAALRGVPSDQLLALDVPADETLQRSDYERAAETIRAWLNGPMRERDIRCLVTFYGLPLKVAAVKPTAEASRRATQLVEAKSRIEAEWTATLEATMRALPSVLQAQIETVLRGRPKPTLWDRHDALRRRWSAYARGLPEAERVAENQRLIFYLERAEGRRVVLELIRFAEARGIPENPEKTATLEQEIKDAETQVRRHHDAEPGAPAFDALLRALRTWGGLAGAAAFLNDRIETLEPPDSEAAFDSELALVERESYPLARWVPNPLRNLRGDTGAAPSALMVARLDGPTPDIVRRMFLDALHAETTGLRGTFYIDARGLRQDDEYQVYDRDLLALAAWVREHTSMPVGVDDRESLFAAGSCPNAALYCGWYALTAYVPAFTFQRGAVGYHIASFELGSLHRTNKAYWCRGLLEDGAAATLGPTSEPYLSAFPRPSEFFGLLLTGELTLVECFARTSPFLSWRVALVGDPLYRPFASNPQVALNLFLESRPDPDGADGDARGSETP